MAFLNFIEQQPGHAMKEWDLLEAMKFEQHAQFKSHGDEGGQVSRSMLSLLEIANARSSCKPKIHEQRILELEEDTLHAYDVVFAVAER